MLALTRRAPAARRKEASSKHTKRDNSGKIAITIPSISPISCTTWKTLSDAFTLKSVFGGTRVRESAAALRTFFAIPCIALSLRQEPTKQAAKRLRMSLMSPPDSSVSLATSMHLDAPDERTENKSGECLEGQLVAAAVTNSTRSAAWEISIRFDPLGARESIRESVPNTFFHRISKTPNISRDVSCGPLSSLFALSKPCRITGVSVEMAMPTAGTSLVLFTAFSPSGNSESKRASTTTLHSSDNWLLENASRTTFDAS
mmetsp:Transcript_20651/g.36303  ORF Transcript_20651/g.36303 Transcript_20651/m.36303 type:complete len:259 (+) Transcript_20651:206-982(+)